MTEESTAPSGVTRQDVFNVLGALGAIITLVAAVMFYFGWRRSDAQARAMSIDVTLFGFSTQDYVLRSISSLYAPLLVIFSLGLLWAWCHHRVVGLLRSGWLDTGSRRSTMLTSVQVALWIGVGLAASCVVFTALVGRDVSPWPIDPVERILAPREWVVPLGLIVSTLVAVYAAWLRRQLVRSDRPPATTLWMAVLPPVLVVATVLLAGFWLLEEYATAVGRDLADDIGAGVHRLPRAVVTSSTPLGIDAPGVVEERITSAGETERYRTTGMRLLARSGGKLLLVHDGWTAATGTIIVLADTDELAWEFSR